MFNSVALEVVIGLLFIYLLYSLLATVLSEMIASVLGLRARNLKEAINRMLTDDKPRSRVRRFFSSLRIMKSPRNPVIDGFYDHPEIKYLGGTGMFRKPSFIRAESFSKALVGELSGDGRVTGEKIGAVLNVSANGPGNGLSGEQKGAIDPESAGYILGLWEESGREVARFRLLLEDWFNRTMQQASEWYRRKIQLVLVVLGFGMAWFFCADTFVIVKKLSVDRNAREQMVGLADAYLRNQPAQADSTLLSVKRKLDADLAGANSLLGSGGWLPDRIAVTLDPVSHIRTYSPQVDPNCLSSTQRKISGGMLAPTFGDKVGYLFRLAYYHFFGFLITAIAISLGAPFWFDLLNKFMKLRTAARDKPGAKPARQA
jgi:hypothetical protein